MKALVSRKEIRKVNSGISAILFQQAQALRSLGYDVYAIAEKIEEADAYTAVKTFRWPISGYFRRKFYANSVAKWIQKNKPEIVIGNGDIFQQDIVCMHNCTHLAYELTYGSPLPVDSEVGRIHQAILSGDTFQILVCNSTMMRRDFTSRFKIPESKSCVIYPSVDSSRFLLEKPMKYRAKFGFSQDEIILGLITSGDFKKRNVELLIRTFAVLKAEFPSLKSFVVGKDKSEAYVKLAAELGVDITFAPAIGEVQYYYNMVDIFVLPAFIEEFGISALEAMASAKPVVLGKNVGAQEILEGRQRDFILDELSIDELAAKLRPLISSAELRQQLGNENRNVAAKYNNERLQAEHCKVISAIP